MVPSPTTTLRMAHYQSNHVAVAYGDILDEMVELSRLLGFRVRVLSRQHA